MKKIVFLTPPDAEFGFRLTGVTQHTARPQTVDDMVRKFMADGDIGLIVIDERLRQGVNEERLRELEKKWRGILLFLPAPERKGAAAEDYALALIRRAIGYHVRLKV